ncbi:IclR family transcriptional regulator C-terminal domain-containing protein [Streptomyces sp. NPDC089799]|uniref:IclR family transcriptional regulator domain-containing protein n=1 Tax=Streptomyces sp. NPDC089799 TaxID=3155066 RepID=UPI00343AEB0D
MNDRYPPHGAPRPRSLAEFLARAGVRDRYPHYDLAAAEARLLRARAGRPGSCARLSGAADPGAGPGPDPARAAWSDPAQDTPVDAERAWRDLKAVAMAAVCAPGAAAVLTAFVNGDHTDLEGAQVFACLLHLAGLRDGARFWWQYTAGSGSEQGAYCLFLDHSRRGEHDDAGVWARELVRGGFTPPTTREAREPLVHGQTAVRRYVVQLDDIDVGPVPLPRRGLERALAALVPMTAPASAARTTMNTTSTTSTTNTAAEDARGDTEIPSPTPSPSPSPSSASASASASTRNRHAGPPRPRHSPGPLRHPALTAGAQRTSVGDAGSRSEEEARHALDLVHALQRHPQGVRGDRLGRETGLTGPGLRRMLAMLCEEQFAHRTPDGIFAPGPALARLAAPGGHGLAAQLQHTLALARDSTGAAVYLSRYADGEVRITQMADGPAAPPVDEWFDFRMAAHASAVGKCLLTQLDHDGRADHVARHKPARLTARTITDSRVLFTALDSVAPGDPVFDLREYSPGVVCSAVPITTGDEAGCLALSMPAAHAHRLHSATAALRHKTVPVLLALLLTGALPPDAAPAARTGPEALRHLRSVFRTPLPARDPSAAGGPHLVSDPSSETAYLFDAPDPGPEEPPTLALPHTFTPFTPYAHTEHLLVLGM